MIILLVDAGNTRVKCCLLSAEHEQAQRDEVFDLGHLDGIGLWLAQQPQQPARAFGVNVAGPEAAQRIEAQLAACCPIEWVRSAPQTLHLSNHYEYTQLGADRWMAMLGVSARYASEDAPIVLASFGTATTVDVVYQNCFLGGLIAPGLDLMSQSLFAKTAQLPCIEWLKFPITDGFPTDTVAAITSGILTAQSGLVLSQWYRARRLGSALPHLIVAGGASNYVLPQLKTALQTSAQQLGFDKITLDTFEDPVLEGLRLVASASPAAIPEQP